MVPNAITVRNQAGRVTDVTTEVLIDAALRGEFNGPSPSLDYVSGPIDIIAVEREANAYKEDRKTERLALLNLAEHMKRWQSRATVIADDRPSAAPQSTGNAADTTTSTQTRTDDRKPQKRGPGRPPKSDATDD